MASPYTKLMIDGAAVLYGAKDIWLETWASNGGAVHVYHKAGFVDVDQEAAERPSKGGAVPDTRLFMSLDNKLILT